MPRRWHFSTGCSFEHGTQSFNTMKCSWLATNSLGSQVFRIYELVSKTFWWELKELTIREGPKKQSQMEETSHENEAPHPNSKTNPRSSLILIILSVTSWVTWLRIVFGRDDLCCLMGDYYEQWQIHWSAMNKVK